MSTSSTEPTAPVNPEIDLREGDGSRVLRPRRAARLLIGLWVGVLAVGLVVVGSAMANSRLAPSLETPIATPGGPAGSVAEFTRLATQRTNLCTLTPAMVQSNPDSGMLEGSCCFPMDVVAYRAQVTGLLTYAGISDLPADPYAISVREAKVLLGYDRSITLNAAQQGIYTAAMSLTDDNGPCCHCWRWNMIEGMATFLIAGDSMGAQEVATIIGL